MPDVHVAGPEEPCSENESIVKTGLDSPPAVLLRGCPLEMRLLAREEAQALEGSITTTKHTPREGNYLSVQITSSIPKYRCIGCSMYRHH